MATLLLRYLVGLVLTPQRRKSYVMPVPRREAITHVAVAAFSRAPWAARLAVKATTDPRKPSKRPTTTRNTAAFHTSSTRYAHPPPSRTDAPSWSSRSNSSTSSSYNIRAGEISQRRRRRRGVSTGAQRGVLGCDEVAAVLEMASATSGKKSVAVAGGREGAQVLTEEREVLTRAVLAREVLTQEAWMARAEAHRARVRALTDGSVHHDRKDPIFNFLFEYYHFKPRMLLQWTPGFDVHLLDADPSLKGSPLPEKAWESGPGRGGHYNPFGLNVNRRNTVRRVRDFLQVTSARPPVFHCYGLHEWAMLYRPAGAEGDSRRLHQTLPLRVSQEEINAMVEGKGGNMGCTHFDAFRFFTPEAKPLNNVVLERSSQKSNEQPGCVHANMDLFKWALRLWPLLPSEKMADALELAVSCRMLDMRASPYDLAAHGKLSPEGAAGKSGGKAGGLPPESWDPSPVRIETEQGRKEYQQAQWDLYHRSVPIRRSLLRHMDKLLEVWGV